MSNDYTYQLFLLESLSVFLTEKGDRLKPAVSLHSPEMHWQENREITAWDVTSACRRVFVSLHCLSLVNLEAEIYTDRSFCTYYYSKCLTICVYILAQNNYCGIILDQSKWGRRLFSGCQRLWQGHKRSGSWIARAFRNHLLRHGFMHRFPQWLWKLMTEKWLEISQWSSNGCRATIPIEESLVILGQHYILGFLIVYVHLYGLQTCFWDICLQMLLVSLLYMSAGNNIKAEVVLVL